MPVDDDDLEDIRQRLQHWERRHDDHTGQVKLLHETIGTVKETLTEHRLRLDNGRGAFEDLRKDLAELRPKRMPRWQIALTVVAPLSILISTVWALSKALDERPTASQMTQAFVEHNKSEHPATIEAREKMQREMVDFRIAQEKQTQLVVDVKQSVDEIKLDLKANSAAKAARAR